MRRPAALLAFWLLPAVLLAGAGGGFDDDRALMISQAALGNRLGDHRFVTAGGEALTLGQLRGKPLVLSLVYTSCHHVCPMTTRHLAGVVDKARAALGDDSFNVAVVGFDSRVDTPGAMAHFARQQGIGDAGWRVLAGSQAAVDALARDTGFRYRPTSSGFDHLVQATVIDADGVVYRQVYGQVFDTPLLVDPLIELVLGRAPPEQPLLSALVAKIRLFCTTYDPNTDRYRFDYSLFIGLAIGLGIIGIATRFVVRAWR